MLQIPESANLADGLAYSSKKVPASTCVKDYLAMLSAADNPSGEGRSACFISYSSSKIQVEFEIIARKLRRNVVETIAREKHGAEGARIVRLLLNSGKLDEKQVTSYLSYFSVCRDSYSADFEISDDGSQRRSAFTGFTFCRLLDLHPGSSQKCRS